MRKWNIEDDGNCKDGWSRPRSVDEHKLMDEKWDSIIYIEERGSYDELIHVYSNLPNIKHVATKVHVV